MRSCSFRKSIAHLPRVLAGLLLAGSFAASAVSVQELVLKHNVKNGEVPTAALLEIVSTTSPKTHDEKELVLKLQLELLERLLRSDARKDKDSSLKLSTTAVNDARALYGMDDVKLIPVLRTAAKTCLHYKEPKRAVDLLTDALRVANIAYGPDDPAIRFIVSELGQAYAASGNAGQARQLAKKAEYLEKLAPAAIQGIRVLASSTPASTAVKPFQLVPVYFQTTRQRTGERDPTAFFGTERAKASSFGVSYISVPRQREIGSIPHASLLKLDFSTDPNRHVVLKGLSLYEGEGSFLKAIKEQLSTSDRKESLLFIHGFNQSFQDGIETAAALAVDLEIDGSVIAYSWPSKKSILRYVADMDESIAAINKAALKDLLINLSASVGSRSVYVIAHSMGNRPLLEALQLMPSPGAAPPFANIVFASPDVESNDFEVLVKKAHAQAKSMTLYTAASDIPLALSETIRTGFFSASDLRRAGDHKGGVKSQAYLEVVDASKAQVDWLGHSNFTQLAKDDLRALLWLGVPARKRCVLQAQQPGWRYDPQQNCTSEAFGMASLYYRRLKEQAQASAQLSKGDPTAQQASEILKAMLRAD